MGFLFLLPLLKDKAFKNFLKDKNLEDLSGDTLVTAFKKIGFVENSVTFNTIRHKVLEDGLNATIILETAEGDIVDEFELSQCKEDKERFLKLRAIIRKTIILRNDPIPDSHLKKKTIENFSKDEIYQLLEEKIKSIDDSQSQRWYSFIEREGMTGMCFVEYDENVLVKSLDLTNSQKITLGKLLQKMEPPVSGQTVVAKHGAFGVVGSAKVSVGRSIKVMNGGRKTPPVTDSSSEDSS